jgi:hypothetical protein
MHGPKLPAALRSSCGAIDEPLLGISGESLMRRNAGLALSGERTMMDPGRISTLTSISSGTLIDAISLLIFSSSGILPGQWRDSKDEMFHYMLLCIRIW